MLSRIKEYFEDRGVTTADFPKAFIAHEFLSVAFLALTWAACYQIQPSKSPLFAPINKTLQSSNNFVVVKMRQSYQTVISRAERRMYQEWFLKRGIDTGRMAVSLAESTVFRKLAKPVTIPAKLWLTWKFVQVVNGQEAQSDIAPEERRRTAGRPKEPEPTKGQPWWGRAQEILDGSPIGRSRHAGARRRVRGRRKAVCPPGGEGGPGCFVPVLVTSPRRFAKQACVW